MTADSPPSTPVSLPRSRNTGVCVRDGFAAAVAMWCVWFVTHLPGVNIPPSLVGTLLLLVLLAGCTVSGALQARRGVPAAAMTGLLTGLVSSLVNLLLLGSFIVEQTDASEGPHALAPGAAVMILGFVGLSAAVGLVGGVLGALAPGARQSTRPAASALPGFAVVAAVAVLPLLLIGGLVTSTDSGLAVPDWPGTYGGNMFLYPISLMTRPRVFFEHSHRLFGTLVGVTTLVMMLWTLFSGTTALRAVGGRPARRTSPLGSESRATKAFAIVLFVLVCIQGGLGGIRVTEQSHGLALVHGVTAQVFLACMVGFATVLSRPFRSIDPANTDVYAPLPATPMDRKLKAISAAALHSTILQLLFGAAYRHFNSAHVLWTHAAFSVVVVITAVAAGFLAGARARHEGQSATHPANRLLSRLGVAIVSVVALQFALGWAALLTVLHYPQAPIELAEKAVDAPPTPVAAALIPTIHQANGALLLALVVVLHLMARQVWKKADKPASTPVAPVVG